jgi:hypothetical protein
VSVNPKQLRDGSISYSSKCGFIFSDREAPPFDLLAANPLDGGIDIRERPHISKRRISTFGAPLPDQRNYGACCMMAALIMLNYEHGIQNYSSQWGIDRYLEVQKIDSFPGIGENPGGDGMQGTSLLDVLDYLMDLGLISGYVQALTLEEVLSGIAYHGVAMFGMMWTTGMMYPGQRTGLSHPIGRMIGGHATGGTWVDKDRELILGPQSWAGWNPKLHNHWAMTWSDVEWELKENRGECYFAKKVLRGADGAE